ncbi:phosphatidylinositol:UDP-GlcNAc transferase [Talaromyces pinophilus]|uniref:Phosphatidylinositol:UDP-GlcNAc transferase n=1 Tax=Talaromyces pinophilus TaxID=128442 RepID=A0A6V8HPQ7_TALPI|nr:phosphatidylinositol:UDP-GlcNAc transferase [Talaromyces pinophilus]
MAPQPQSPPPVPPPVPVETHPNRAGGLKPPLPQRVPPDPTRLAPEHAYAHPQTRLWQDGSSHLRPIDGIVATPASVAALRPPPAVPGTEPRKNDIRKFRDGRRKKRKGVWKKLLWVRQSYSGEVDDGSSASSTASQTPAGGPQTNDHAGGNVHGLGLDLPRSGSEVHLRRRSTGMSVASFQSMTAGSSSLLGQQSFYSYDNNKSLLSPRNRQRLATIKSALLIYCALLGLSPILKSLTKSTASDSIWALSCWLMIINIFSFDYGSGEGQADATKFPASLSTNAALMASTVLASRLPSTTHVFSLTLFSIEVFGLFPVFRRQLRHVSWTGHVLLTFALVLAAGAGVGTALRGGWAAAIVGAILSTILTALAMGSCSWWLISLQKYKNVVIGPWDPARPIIRRNWD